MSTALRQSAPARARRLTAQARRLGTEVLPPAAVIVAVFVLWEAAVRLFRVPVFVLPAPSVVWKTLLTWWGAIWFNAAQTLYTTLAGFGLAVAAGLGLGLLIGYSTLVYQALYPLLVGFNSVPKAAIVPVLVIWFGIGTVPAIITDVLRSLGASKREIFLKIGIPRSLPYFFASLKVAATLAFVGAVISETVAANRGIGYMMLVASSRFEVPLVFAGLIVVAVMGVLLFAVFAVLERRLTGWAYRGQAPGV